MATVQLRLMPAGECWCGCAQETPIGSFFAPGHDKRAEVRVITEEFGEVVQFLAAFGYAPNTFDNCPSVYNPTQLNSDAAPVDNGPGIAGNDGTIPNGDGLGDACDPDNDNDQILNANEFSATACAPYDLSTTTHLSPVFGDVTNDDNHNGNPAPPMGTDAADNGPSWDTDNDGVLDGVECRLGTNPRNRASRPTVLQCANLLTGGTGPNTASTDADHDGLTAATENCKWGTSDLSSDSDGDGLGDCREAADIDGDALITFPGDVLGEANAFFTGQGSADLDIDGDALITFPGDVLQIAGFFFGTRPCG